LKLAERLERLVKGEQGVGIHDERFWGSRELQSK